MVDVFISYSRRNLEFVHKLDTALSACGKASWFDQKKDPLEGLLPGSKWWDEIKHGIESADNFLLIISPESIASPYCNAEIAHAIQHEKRLLTVLYCGNRREADNLKAVDAAIDAIPEESELPTTVSATINNLRSLTRRNWLEISRVQYVKFFDDGLFDRALEQLVEALDMDLAWLRTWSQVRQTARIWAETKDDSYLWSEMRLKPVREMVEKRKQPLTEVEREFIRPEAEHLLTELDNIDTSHTRRSIIGERLCVIGDPRRGVGLRSDGLPDIAWCYVDVPEHLRGKPIEFIGSRKAKEEKYGEFEVKPFFIAKYPITYMQFQAFLDDPDGFERDEWWEGLMENYHKYRMAEQRMKFPNHPRDSVSWFHAIAFCRWLHAKLPMEALPEPPATQSESREQLDKIPNVSQWGIRLPTEWEWQYAATGGQPSNEYPWGLEWDSGQHCNTEESGLGRTIAAGMYPRGASPVGALDMSGNVWEWCLTEYADPTNTGIAGNMSRALRGGCWDWEQEDAHCRSRYGFTSDSMYVFVGFRVVCAPSLKI
ncbi:MAG TPA: SUMF1/EgtB/PvdO family nonheme iron enzyme [Aggregatilineaceae bacterium]|nr:SUMF1/EgtB/PvdO family nonheme iron enzyme [Aggregatilineaceae bacterium]